MFSFFSLAVGVTYTEFILYYFESWIYRIFIFVYYFIHTSLIWKKGKHTHFIICLQWFIYKIIQILMSCLFCFKLSRFSVTTTLNILWKKKLFYCLHHEWYLFSCPLHKLYNETIHNCLLYKNNKIYLFIIINVYMVYKEIFIINKVLFIFLYEVDVMAHNKIQINNVVYCALLQEVFLLVMKN